MVLKRRSRISVFVYVALLLTTTLVSWSQTLTYLPLQQPGQASVAIDLKQHSAYIIDLGKAGDGDTVNITTANKEIGLFEYLDQQGVKTLTVICSHPHSDHMGGIMAAFRKLDTFIRPDGSVRFDTVNIVDDGLLLSGRLDTTIRATLKSTPPVVVNHISAREKNALVGISNPSDDVYIQTVPYAADPAAGPHGRSVVSRIKLGQKNSIVDFDDADNSVITKAVAYLKAHGVDEIDGFVVPHHGSAFHDIQPILSLNPKTAIIAVNPANKYGHPAAPILRALMDKLGPENVIFTGSDGRVELDPDGLKYARYTAADAESYALFVDPSRRRAERLGHTKDVADYKAIRDIMMKDDDTPPEVASAPRPTPPVDNPGGDAANPASSTVENTPRPPRPAAVARREAYASRIHNNGTALSEELDAGFIQSGGVQPAVLQRSRLFRNTGSAQTTVWIARDEEYDALPKKNASISPTELAVIRDHLSLAGTAPRVDTPITVISRTDSGAPNPAEPLQYVTKKVLDASLNAAPPGGGHTPKGGMVYLTGGKLFAAANASELLGGTLDICGNAPCVTFPGSSSQPFHLPFAFDQLFAEVWSRVHDRAIDTFYLSINPTKSWLKNSDAQAVSSERLLYGTSLNPTAANQVVTAGDIQGTQIGRILWESDVAFKSAGVGFDVLKGRNGQQVRAVTSLSYEDDSARDDMDFSQGDRWCRLYWESGSLSMSANPETRNVNFTGNAVTARAQAMVLKAGQLQDYERGGWCGEAKHIARELQTVANSSNGPLPTLNELRQLATIQTFARWARDNGLPLTDQFKSALAAHETPTSTFLIPTWTSGIRSTGPVMIQKQTNRGTNTYLLHVSFSSSETLEKCVLPFWQSKDKELPVLGLKKKNNVWEGDDDTFPIIDRWMTSLSNRVALCSGGVLLDPAAVGSEPVDFLTERSRQGSFAILPHAQPVSFHGGILLGRDTDSLENFWKSGDELRSPLGRLLFRQNGNSLQFWSSQTAVPGGAEARNYVLIKGGSVWKTHLHNGHLRFIVETLPGSVVRKEMRILPPAETLRGLEWVEARNGQDGSVISHSAIQKCPDLPPNAPECFTMDSVGETALSPVAHSLGYDTAPPIAIRQLQEGIWLVDLHLDSVYDEIDQMAGTAQDNAARISKLIQYRRWGNEGERLNAAQLAIPQVEQDTQDTLLTRQDDQEARDFIVALRIALEQNQIQESLGVDGSLTRASFNGMVSELDQLDKLIANLSPESSGPLYKTQSEILDAAAQLAITSKTKSDLIARQALYEEWVTLDGALALGAGNPWPERPSPDKGVNPK